MFDFIIKFFTEKQNKKPSSTEPTVSPSSQPILLPSVHPSPSSSLNPSMNPSTVPPSKFQTIFSKQYRDGYVNLWIKSLRDYKP
jgi:hypothetical protein